MCLIIFKNFLQKLIKNEEEPAKLKHWYLGNLSIHRVNTSLTTLESIDEHFTSIYIQDMPNVDTSSVTIFGKRNTI